MADPLKHDAAVWATAGDRRAVSIPNKRASERRRSCFAGADPLWSWFDTAADSGSPSSK